MPGESSRDERRSPVPQLKLLRAADLEALPPDEGPPGLTAQDTLSDVYEHGFKPIWADPKKLSDLTLDDYETSLALWRKLSPENAGSGGEPRLWELEGTSGDRIAGRFMARLADEPGNRPGATMSVGTQRKHARNINKLLAFAGPKLRTRHGRKNLEIIADPTLIEAPSPDGNAPEGDWTFEEVGLMWVAAKRMDSQKLRALGIDPVLWWRAILTVAAHTGLRRKQLLGLAFSDLKPPHVLVRPARSKRRSGRKQYLSAEALLAIEAIRTSRERIFPWPYLVGQRRAVNVRHLDFQLRKLAERAGLPRDRWFGWNGFRKLTACGAFEIGGEDGTKAVLGHATGSRVAMQHYVSGTAQTRRAAEIIDQLPSPRPASEDDRRQGRLF